MNYMTISLEDMQRQMGLSPERRLQIKARSLQLEAEREAFLKTCRAWDLTLKQLTHSRDIDEAAIQEEASKADVILGTLKNFVEAAGGKLSLSVEYPGIPPIEIESFRYLDPDDEAGTPI